MYLPGHFAESRSDALHACIRDWPLATLITNGASGLNINHVPLILQATGDGVVLQGHVPRANPVGDDLAPESAVVAIFHGPNAYVSPSWYPAKHRHGRVVPTWNYQVVHVEGRLSVRHDAAWIRNQLDALTTQQEASMPAPWRIDDAPAEYVNTLVAQLKGLEIVVDRMTGKTKASQNQAGENRDGVFDALSRRAGREAEAMAALVRPEPADPT